MNSNRIGNSELVVSEICLGTMTFGEQNTESEAHEQLDYATANEVNFIDTAEMYPVPAMEETFTKTETIIGNWLEKRGRRDERPAYTSLYRFLLETRVAAELDAVGFSNPLVCSTHREPSLYL